MRGNQDTFKEHLENFTEELNKKKRRRKNTNTKNKFTNHDILPIHPSSQQMRMTLNRFQALQRVNTDTMTSNQCEHSNSYLSVKLTLKGCERKQRWPKTCRLQRKTWPHQHNMTYRIWSSLAYIVLCLFGWLGFSLIFYCIYSACSDMTPPVDHFRFVINWPISGRNFSWSSTRPLSRLNVVPSTLPE